MYVCPDLGVGVSGSPLVTVLSFPVLTPRGPTISYCPDLGAFSPGFKPISYCLLN